MVSFLRDRLIPALSRLWWVALLAVAAAILYGGIKKGFEIVHLIALATMFGVTGLVSSMWLLEGFVGIREGIRRRRSSLTFLCPTCLRFGSFRYSCPECGNAIRAFFSKTESAAFDTCPYCFTAFTSDLRARCVYCNATCDPTVFHERRVRIVGTLFAKDYDWLKRIAKARPCRSNTFRFCYFDDGSRLTYILDLSDLTRPPRGSTHSLALSRLEAVWVSGTDDDSLKLGRAADGLARHPSMTRRRRRSVLVCTSPDDLEFTNKQILRTRFGTIKYGVSAADFIRNTQQSALIEPNQVSDLSTVEPQLEVPVEQTPILRSQQVDSNR